MSKPLQVGASLGNVKVVARVPHEKYKYFYKFHCKKCGYDFYGLGGYLRHYSTGCPMCRKNQKNEEKAKKHVGEVYGTLKVLGPWELRSEKHGKREQEALYVLCKCMRCGGETYIKLSRLLEGGAKKCWECSQKDFLPKGREKVKEESACGTAIFSLSQKKSKNNSTGYKGVSYHKTTGRYRAYINFQRKQYYLGEYDTAREAAEARAIGEKKIYGDFLKWYEENKSRIKSGEITDYTVK